MRTRRSVLALLVVVAFLTALAPVAVAQGDSRGERPDRRGRCDRIRPLYRVTKPHVVRPVVVAGATFEASGSVMPTITAGDTSTTVAILVLKGGKHARPAVVSTVPATLTEGARRGTGYTASLSLPGEGRWALVAVVLKDGVIVGRSEPRDMKARLPYRLTKPRVARSSVVASTTFEASGSVVPTIPAGDGATVAILVMKPGRCSRASVVATVPATLTENACRGTGYQASLSLPTTGRWTLVAVVMKDGTILGRSEPRMIKARAAAPCADLRSGRRR